MKQLKRFITREIIVLGNGFEQKEIVINENPMLMMMFKGLNLNVEEVERIDWMIKVKFESQAQATELKNLPLTIEGANYFFYLSTPADMKNEKAIYVREDVIGAIRQYESIVSCGWLDSLEGQVGVNVNKDVTARLSLFLSSSYHTNIRPNYLVLPEVEYKTIQNIRTFKNGEFKIEENYEHNSVFADGCGIASPALMRRVSKELKLGYEPCFVGVRSIKLALKGLLVSIDIIKYFNDIYKGDTDTLKKVNGKFIAIDVWGNEVEINDNTIIVNESMCKWAKKISLEEFEDSRPEELANIMDALFITKTSKENPADYKKTSYQLLCQLGLNASDYNEITKETYNLLSGVIAGDKESIYHFLGAINEEDAEEVEISDRLALLLRADFERFYKLPWVRRTLANMVERSVKELCSGKFYVEADFKTIVNAPIGILNFIINREINDSLEANEFWCNTLVEEVLACRFPIASYSEVGAMDFVEDSLYNKYCGHWTKELCVFNAKDIRAKILSGADFDTDTIFTSSNMLLIDSIITPKDGLHFIGTEENKGNLGEVAYNWNTRTEANTAYMGNIIGEVAILNACISNVAQDLGVYVDGKNVTYRNYFKDKIATPEEAKEFWSWFGKQERTMNLPKEIVKEVIANQFYEVEEVIYKTVETSMIAIDAPKTGIMPDLEFIKNLKSNYRKPYYFKFLPEKDIKFYELERYNGSVIESYARWNEANSENWKGIIARIEYYKNNSSWKNDDIFKELFKMANTFTVDEVKVAEVQTMIEESFKSFNSQRSKRDKKYLVMEQIELEDGSTVDSDKAYVDANGNYVREYLHKEYIRTIMTKTMCFKAERVALEVANKFAGEDVCIALFRVMNNNVTGLQRFIFDFYFKYVEAMVSIEYPEFEVLVESEEGKTILGKTYAISKKALKEANIGDRELERFETKKEVQSQNVDFKVGFKKEVTVELKENDYIILEVANNADIFVFASTGEKLGKAFVSNKVNLYALKSAKLVIKESKATDKSYNVQIKAIEA